MNRGATATVYRDGSLGLIFCWRVCVSGWNRYPFGSYDGNWLKGAKRYFIYFHYCKARPNGSSSSSYDDHNVSCCLGTMTIRHRQDWRQIKDPVSRNGTWSGDLLTCRCSLLLAGPHPSSSSSLWIIWSGRWKGNSRKFALFQGCVFIWPAFDKNAINWYRLTECGTGIRQPVIRDVKLFRSINNATPTDHHPQ